MCDRQHDKCHDKNYKERIIAYLFIQLDKLLKKENFKSLKYELQKSINNGSLEINTLAVHFYKYVSDYLLRKLERFFSKGQNFQIEFGIYGATNFFYSDSFQFSPEDIIFFS